MSRTDAIDPMSQSAFRRVGTLGRNQWASRPNVPMSQRPNAFSRVCVRVGGRVYAQGVRVRLRKRARTCTSPSSLGHWDIGTLSREGREVQRCA